MGPEVHRQFTKVLLEKTNLPSTYTLWAESPDEDMFKYHRFWYHRIFQFQKLYNLCIQKYDMQHALDTKIIYPIFLGHLYLDMCTGPIKVFDGINITCHHQLLDNISIKGYEYAINTLHKVINPNTEKYIEMVYNTFKKLEIYDIDTIQSVFINRLIEETIGTGVPKYEYNQNNTYILQYNEMLKMEEKIISYIDVL